MSNDKPKNIISVADLDYEANPDPIRLALPFKDGEEGSRFVTFPDVYDMPIEKAEDFFSEMAQARASGVITPALKKWLNADDYAALIKAFPSIRALGPVIERVMTRYESLWGSEGEGDASAT